MNRSFVLGLLVLGLLLVTISAPFLTAQDKGIPGVNTSTPLGQVQQQFLMQFDANKDGRLDAQEQMLAQEVMRRNGMNLGIPPGGSPGAEQFTKQFDVNRDGKLSPQEAAMAQAAFQRMRGGGAGGGVRSGGGGGSGSVPQQPVQPIAPAADNKPAKVSPLVKRFDKNGDGTLNAEEKAAAQAEFKKDKDKPKDKDNDKEKAKAKDKEAKKDKDGKPAEKDNPPK